MTIGEAAHADGLAGRAGQRWRTSYDAKTKSRGIYWTLTIVILAPHALAGIWGLFTNGPEVELMAERAAKTQSVASLHQLGYPVYLLKILGVCAPSVRSLPASAGTACARCVRAVRSSSRLLVPHGSPRDRPLHFAFEPKFAFASFSASLESLSLRKPARRRAQRSVARGPPPAATQNTEKRSPIIGSPLFDSAAVASS